MCTQKHRIDMNDEKDYMRMLHIMGVMDEGAGFINLDAADVDTLKAGDTVFLWESAIAATEEEAAAMVKKALEEMAPAPGNVILTSILYITVDFDRGLDTVEEISSQITESFSEDVRVIFGARFSNELKGIRFVLATAEGRTDSNSLRE